MHSRTLAVVMIGATAASAQWLHYPTAGIPRTRDGKPNLSAPAPKTRERKPDLTGLWIPQNDPDTKGTNGELLPKLFIDIGSGLKDGELVMQPGAKVLLDQRLRTHEVDDPLTLCKPLGGPKLIAIPAPFKIIQTPELIVIMHEMENVFRQIHVDGRKLPEDPQPSTLGYSAGRWEGDALVVDSIGFHDEGWLDAMGHPHSDAMRMTERFRRPDFGHMEVQITIDDPKSYKKPFTVTQMMEFLPDSDLLEYFCSENERDVRHFVK